MTDPQREGRQLHRYRGKIAALKRLLADVRTVMQSVHGAGAIGQEIDAKTHAWLKKVDAALQGNVDEAASGEWIPCFVRTPDVDGVQWFIFERQPDGDYNVTAEYYHFIEGWATDSEVVAWWSERMVPPRMPLPERG